MKTNIYIYIHTHTLRDKAKKNFLGDLKLN